MGINLLVRWAFYWYSEVSLKCGIRDLENKTEYIPVYIKYDNGSYLLSKLSYQVIIEMTNGGDDYCFECVGLGTLVQEAFACCRKVSPRKSCINQQHKFVY